MSKGLEGLQSLLHSNQIVTDSRELESYGRDWTRLHTPQARAALFPESTEDVVKIVKWARQTKIALVPSGGRTGLSAGAVATQNEVVVSLARMKRILNFSPIDRLVHVQAGVVTEDLQNYIEDQGYFFPIDLASRGSSQIGGNISTNAGGTKVIRFGHTRDWVAGLRVVTGTGQILNLDRALIKDNVGYDLKQLFIAGEGTLGLITEAHLRVTNKLPDLSVILLATNDLAKVMDILMLFREKLELTGFEFFTDTALTYVMKQQGYTQPFGERYPVYALIEFENPKQMHTDLALDLFDICLGKGWALDGAMSQSREQAESFWKYRENISESLAPFKPYKNDISVQISKMPEFVRTAETSLRQKFPQLEFVWFGHIGDGNLHINILPQNMDDAQFRAQLEPLSQELFGLLQQFNGSLSAEHGIGLIKKPYLHYTVTPGEIAFMREIKKVFDPDHIMNPGKIFDLAAP